MADKTRVISISTMRLVHRLHMLNFAKGSFTGSFLDAILLDAQFKRSLPTKESQPRSDASSTP